MLILHSISISFLPRIQLKSPYLLILFFFFFNPDLLYDNLANHVLVLEKNTGDVTLLTLQCCLFHNHSVFPCKLYTHFRI